MLVWIWLVVKVKFVFGKAGLVVKRWCGGGEWDEEDKAQWNERQRRHLPVVLMAWVRWFTKSNENGMEKALIYKKNSFALFYLYSHDTPFYHSDQRPRFWHLKCVKLVLNHEGTNSWILLKKKLAHRYKYFYLYKN